METRHTRPDPAAIRLSATIIASVLFVMLAMNHPLRGDLGITAEAHQRIEDHLIER